MVTVNAQQSVKPSLGRGGKRAPTPFLLGPAMIFLIICTQIPFLMTIYYSFRRFNLLNPDNQGWVGLRNYVSLLQDPVFWKSLSNTLVLVGSVLVVTVLFGLAFAMLFNQRFPGRDIARTLVISPFFIMPVVSALIWKNMLMHPVYGLFAWVAKLFGLEPVDWLATFPMQSIVMMVSWQWIPFALLILLTGLASLPSDVLEAAKLDGANAWQEFRFVIMPHLSQTISVVVMLESIFLLTIFAEIFASTSGGPGLETTTLPYLIYLKAFFEWQIGAAAAGAMFAVVLANIVSAFVLRSIARNLQTPKAVA
jgi:sorbitol/mannitol transport system permease protein